MRFAAVVMVSGLLSTHYSSGTKTTKTKPKKIMRPPFLLGVRPTKTPQKPKVKETPKEIEETEVSQMPNWTPLYLDSDFYEHAGGFAVTYSKYLVGTSGTNNDNWWDWSFQNRYNNNSETGGFARTKIKDKNSLKEACRQAYRGTLNAKNEIIPQDHNTEGIFKESDIWLFCSPAEEKIETLKDSKDTFASNTYGSKYKDDLVSVKSQSKGNTWFWTHEAQAVNKYDNVRKRFSLKDIEELMKAWCEKVYGSRVSSNFFEADSIFRHCSISGIAPFELIKQKKKSSYSLIKSSDGGRMKVKDSKGQTSTLDVWKF